MLAVRYRLGVPGPGPLLLLHMSLPGRTSSQEAWTWSQLGGWVRSTSSQETGNDKYQCFINTQIILIKNVDAKSGLSSNTKINMKHSLCSQWSLQFSWGSAGGRGWADELQWYRRADEGWRCPRCHVWMKNENNQSRISNQAIEFVLCVPLASSIHELFPRKTFSLNLNNCKEHNF